MNYARIYDREGNEIDELQWAALSKDPDYLTVKKTITPGGRCLIWTTWLGRDRSGNPEHPYIFESSIFDAYLYNARQQLINMAPAQLYSTEHEASAGHATLVKNFSELEQPSHSTDT